MFHKVYVAQKQHFRALGLSKGLVQNVDCPVGIVATKCQEPDILHHNVGQCLDFVFLHCGGVPLKVELLGFFDVVLPLLEVYESD